MLIHFRSLALMLLISIVLFGCASDKVVKTYQGKVLSEDVIAVLTAPENITLLSVNGVEVQQYLLSNLSVNYALKPGENLIAFKYKSIWSKVKRDQETGARVDVVESQPLEVLISATSGAKYNFSVAMPSNLKEARILADDFVAKVVDENNNIVAESSILGGHQKSGAALLAGQKEPLLDDKIDGANKESQEGVSVIEQLKRLWPNANANERKEFLSWVFQ